MAVNANGRKYQVIWELIKSKSVDPITGRRTVKLEVHPAFFSRVIKAVIKEKNQDLGFKIMNDHDSFRLVIEKDVKGKLLRFTLKQKLGLEGIRV